MKKILLGLLLVLSSLFILTGCGSNHENEVEPSESYEVDDPNAEVYCNIFYDVSLGNCGSFTLLPLNGNEFVDTFDLSKIELAGAFTGMTLTAAVYNQESNSAVFGLEGALASGENGIVKGEGIIKGKNVTVNVPITEAQAKSENVLNSNAGDQIIEISLISACFNKDITPADFKLEGSAKNMTIKSVKTDYQTNDAGEIVLSQIAHLTLTGEPDGSSYAYIDISSRAITYNEDLRISIKNDYCGAYLLNESIDSYNLSDIIYVQGNNITFNKEITKDEITLEGALKDYAVIEEVDYVNETLLGIRLSFPYSFIDHNNSIGYFVFSQYTNYEQISFSCSGYMSSPKIDGDVKVTGTTATATLTLSNEYFKIITSPIITNEKGEVLNVSGINVVEEANVLVITFEVPQGYSGMLHIEVKDAYDIVKPDGSLENVTIMLALYV